MTYGVYHRWNDRDPSDNHNFFDNLYSSDIDLGMYKKVKWRDRDSIRTHMRERFVQLRFWSKICRTAIQPIMEHISRLHSPIESSNHPLGGYLSPVNDRKESSGICAGEVCSNQTVQIAWNARPDNLINEADAAQTKLIKTLRCYCRVPIDMCNILQKSSASSASCYLYIITYFINSLHQYLQEFCASSVAWAKNQV